MNIRKKYFVLLVTIIGLLALNQVTIQYFLFQKIEDSDKINIAGRQRMLSQRVNLYAYRDFALNEHDFRDLQNYLKEWEIAHQGLMNGSEALKIGKTTNEDIYNELMRSSLLISEVSSIFANQNPLNNSEVHRVNSLLDQFLWQMESIVKDFEIQSERKLRSIMWLEICLALITLLVIYFEIKMVVRPAYSKLLQQNDALKLIAWQHSHSLKKPLTNILAYGKLLKEDNNASDQEREIFLEYVVRESEELESVVQEIVAESFENSQIIQQI